MRSDGDAAKDPRQLESEVDQQRRRLGETINALEDKFSPGEIYSHATEYFRSHGGEFAESFGNSIKANPLPVALTSIGILWMMVGQRSTNQQPGSGAEKTKDKAAQLKSTGASMKGRMTSARDRASESSQQMREKASATGRQLRGSAGRAREGLSHSVDAARSNFDVYMREQPLVLGALGIALGALVGASLPRTQAEHRAMGGISERARQKASEMAEQGYQKASEVGESVSREAQQSLQSQGRTQPLASKNEGPSTTP